MTLPPGLMAVREMAAFPVAVADKIPTLVDLGHKVPALLDLIETLAGALKFYAERVDADGISGAHARAALDKYREFK